MPEILATLCLDPARPVESYRPRFFPSLVPSLRELRAAWIERKSQRFVETEVSRRVWEALDYGLQARCMVLADGPARTGKTFAVKEWVRRQAGMARYVQVPPTTDRKSFFRAIALALGVPVNLNSKSWELEERIEQTLHGGDLALVLDEAHYCWQQSNRPTSKPDRVNWLLVELVNFEVALSLVTTPQFYHSQKHVERATGWSSEQFLGRIGHVERLPERLEWDDLLAVAKAALPEATAKVARGLAAYAESSARHLASIDAIAKRARYLASRAGRSGVLDEDVANAMKQSVIPSDSALANALDEPVSSNRRTARKGGRMAPASPVQSRFMDTEKPVLEAPDRTDFRPVESLGRLKQPAQRGVEDAALIAAG
ncbi:MAG TPA: ATP-binding protein [Candidatus Paceibacterota bacterium]|nr:ATP-binding protein [Candidatus Paceibacterota bacterium]HRZ54644.1 ATP-binding protein [Candidatus Paceibacterota bacterium]